MASQIGYYDTLKSVAGKVFTYLASIIITGTDGKTLTVMDDTTVGGAAVNPTLPAFLAYQTANQQDNVTGDGTFVDALFNTEVFDLAANFTGGVFTAPVTGKYRLTANVNLAGTAANHTLIIISLVTSNRTYSVYDKFSVAIERVMHINALCDMDAGDTAKISIYAGPSGSKVVDIVGSANGDTYFCGELVC